MSLSGFAVVVGQATPVTDASAAISSFFTEFGRGTPTLARLGDVAVVHCSLLAGVRASAPGPVPFAVLQASAESMHEKINDHRELTLCFDGWLENGVEVAQACGVGALDDREIVMAAYCRWGDNVGRHLAGEYSFVIWNDQTKTLFALRDKVGVRPLFYALAGDGVVVGNLPGAVASHPAVDGRVDPGYAAEFLCAEELTFTDTLYAGVKRLPGGHQLSWQAGRGVSVRRYWAPPAAVRRIDAREAQSEFNDLLYRAVSRAAHGVAFVGCDLSGGVDSSSVAVQLGRLVRSGERHAEATAALSLVYPGLPCDESPYIDAVVANLPFVSLRFTSDYASVQECETATRMLRYPFFPFNSTGASPIVDVVRERGGVLLSGEGGDELFEPTEHALRAALWCPQDWRALCAYLRHHWAQRGDTRSWLGRLRYAVAPFAGQRLQNFMNRWRDRARTAEGWPVDPAWAKAVRLRHRLDRLLYPRNARTLAMGCALSGAWSPSFEWLFFASCVSGVETRHPLSSSRLMEFCNGLPPGLLDGQESRNRLLLRQASGGDLPTLIANRTTKAEFTPATLPALRQRGMAQLQPRTGTADVESGSPRTSWYRADVTGARHIWKLDAALSFELWLRQLAEADRCGLGLRIS